MTCKQCIIMSIKIKQVNKHDIQTSKELQRAKTAVRYSIIGDQGLTLELDPVHLKS